ncbi:unnamed protein product, partial [Ectocarpus sp. 4 AP-2014]
QGSGDVRAPEPHLSDELRQGHRVAELLVHSPAAQDVRGEGRHSREHCGHHSSRPGSCDGRWHCCCSCSSLALLFREQAEHPRSFSSKTLAGNVLPDLGHDG